MEESNGKEHGTCNGNWDYLKLFRVSNSGLRVEGLGIWGDRI